MKVSDRCLAMNALNSMNYKGCESSLNCKCMGVSASRSVFIVHTCLLNISCWMNKNIMIKNCKFKMGTKHFIALYFLLNVFHSELYFLVFLC